MHVDRVEAMSQLEWKSVGSGQVYNTTPIAMGCDHRQNTMYI